ncbi:protein sorting system archaetidylserine decarboxylase [Haloplanus aerogenes]|uniref:Phosphatidylserine decarboxylase n=1 Tax=Haloplanus aerogenes TaxID=660522 RepID=A0A3G8QWP7_9EURY|nr:protein sorting system archaetidylserine decarboxylase [Haloplanus aerogenes]AZH27003.1 phosphatidylserine decarboxylase [Haloplanus aerogenes]RMB13506.1 phosphatidylserine decarboxylase [Haloplanus aerogenes]
MTGPSFSLAPGARRFALPPLVAALPLAIVAPPLGALALALGGFVIWFFRDPERTPPPNGVVAPADGRVSVVREEDDCLRVGVFMNVTDVHVLRAPMDGTVETATHRPGAHRPAFTKDSDRNERVDVTLDTHGVSMIAGWFARRIYPYLTAGDEVARGDRIGHIAFGSRADVRLPAEYDRDDLLVSEGDKVRAGETVVALRSR